MDGADVRLFQRLQREVQPLLFLVCRRVAREVERFPQPQLQFAGGLLREGHGHDPAHFGAARRQDADDAVHELSRLARARRRLDDQRGVESGRDGVSRFLIG